MTDLFNTGIRPLIDAHIDKLSREKRDYGNYWSASSAGYCMRKVIFDRLQIPYTTDSVALARKQRVFSAGDIFHEWAQRITKEAGLSIAQEIELQDEDLMIRGHIDDLVLVKPEQDSVPSQIAPGGTAEVNISLKPNRLILYDYKTRSSRSFNFAKVPSPYHRMQIGTYMYMLRKRHIYSTLESSVGPDPTTNIRKRPHPGLGEPLDLTEARTLNIEKDTLRMAEVQYLWDSQLESDVLGYWNKLNQYWKDKKVPPCTCQDFMAKEKFNDYFYEGEPCSMNWALKHKEQFSKWREI